MRRLSVLVLPIVAVALAACSSASSTPSWTYAPAPSITPAPSGGASGSPAASGAASGSPSAGPSAAPSAAPSVEPSAVSSAAPSAAPSAGGSAGPSGPPSGIVLTITAPVGAATAGYQPTTLSTAAEKAFTIHFDNQDNQAPHNVQLKDAGGTLVPFGGDTPFFQGPGTRDYTVPPLKIGTYTYFCMVHPSTMIGTLTVQ
jgi:plastocyanin